MKFSISLILIFLFACRNETNRGIEEKSIESIKITCIGFDLQTYSRITCDSFKESSEMAKSVVIRDEDTIEKLMKALSELKATPELYEADTRAHLVIVYKDNSVKEICLGGVVEYDNQSFFISSSLVDLIEKEVEHANVKTKKSR